MIFENYFSFFYDGVFELWREKKREEGVKGRRRRRWMRKNIEEEESGRGRRETERQEIEKLTEA